MVCFVYLCEQFYKSSTYDIVVDKYFNFGMYYPDKTAKNGGKCLYIWGKNTFGYYMVVKSYINGLNNPKALLG